MSLMETLLYNKKAHFNYEILQKLDAGAELFGFEVKSLKAKSGSLEGAYVTIRGGEAFITGAKINPLQPKNLPKEYDPTRPIKLLLTKKEILILAEVENKKGLTIVPLSVYNSKRKVKVEIAIARGKREFDKREIIKKRDTEREIRRTLKTEG